MHEILLRVFYCITSRTEKPLVIVGFFRNGNAMGKTASDNNHRIELKKSRIRAIFVKSAEPSVVTWTRGHNHTPYFDHSKWPKQLRWPKCIKYMHSLIDRSSLRYLADYFASYSTKQYLPNRWMAIIVRQNITATPCNELLPWGTISKNNYTRNK